MFFVLAAAGLCLLTLVGFSRALAGSGRLVLVGFDGVGVLAAFVVTVGAATMFGPINGLSLVIALLIHEAGHFVGARACGRTEASFRLLPAFGGIRPDDEGFTHDAERFFHALMGAGGSVAPMLLSVALWLALRDVAPLTAEFMRALGLCLAMVNVLNLMPFRPLDGGLCIEVVSRTLSPAILYLATATAMVGLAFAGYAIGSWAALGFGCAGLILLLLHTPGRRATVAMTASQANLAFLAWAVTLAAHLAGGFAIVQGS
jgi:hypothetical protein